MSEEFRLTFPGGGAKLVGPADEAVMLSAASFYTITGKPEDVGWSRLVVENESSRKFRRV